jgi:oxygen-dependent protoporphyrinogen oxidase
MATDNVRLDKLDDGGKSHPWPFSTQADRWKSRGFPWSVSAASCGLGPFETRNVAMQAPISHVAIIGGGLAGLAAAEAIVAANPAGTRVTIIESSGRFGGVLETRERDGGWLVERSADCFLAARPEGIGLVERLGLAGELVGVDPRVRRALIWHQGRAVPVPHGFRLLAPGHVSGILSSPLFSLPGKVRILAERFVPRRQGGPEESLEQFVTRRLGREAFDRLVQPLAAGIWTADPAKLGMAAACPEFLAMEQEKGSLWAGERARIATVPAAAATGARYGQFVTFVGGMETLPRALATHLREKGAVMIEGRADRLDRVADQWQVTLKRDGGESAPETVTADAVIVATPSPVAAVLLAGVDQGLAADLAGIAYAGSVIVSLGFRRAQVAHPLDAAGLVVPRIAGRRGLAISFSSSKFPGRAPDGCVLMRVFVGGALDPSAVGLDDDALVALARDEAAAIVGAAGEPLLVQVDRWAGSMPQYHVGHADRVNRIEAALSRHPRLTLAGNAYRGVGIPQVIASGQAAAARVMNPGR